MKTEELIRKLNSVGKQIFVKEFDLFQRYAARKISRNQAIGELVTRKVSNESGAGIRVGNAKLIFEAEKEMEALSIVIESKRLPVSVIEEARVLLR